MHYRTRVAKCLALLVLAFASCSSDSDIQSVTGTVSVDGKPVEAGTVHLRSVDPEQSRGFGAVIDKGTFSLSQTPGISPGKYLITVQASASTGRTIKDQQKGNIAELKPLELTSATQEIEITSASANGLNLEFATGAQM